MRTLLGRLLLAALCLLGAGASAAPARNVSLTLTRDGRPAATIVIAKNASRAAQLAAFELQWHVRQMTGAELPLVRDDQSPAGTRILVGESAATAALGLSAARLGLQEYVIRFVPGGAANGRVGEWGNGRAGAAGSPTRPFSHSPTLVLLGKDKDDRAEVLYDTAPDQAAMSTWPGFWDEQGTMHAVYEFLERSCGVRWFNPTESGTVLPRTKTLIVAGADLRRAPFFRYRFAAYPSSENYDLYTGLWQHGSEGYKAWESAAYPELHRRFPDAGRYQVAKRGWVQLFRYRMREGGEKCVGNHSLYGYYKRFWEKASDNPGAFVEKHADWFAQGYDGTPPQMCYTSPGLVRQVAQDARDYFDGKGLDPWGMRPIKSRDDVWGENYFCVEPMDNAQFCRCARCQEWLKGQDAFDPFFSSGRHSDYFFQFVNAVAQELAKTHPERKIVTLAYMTHAEHPKHVHLAPNVVVQYCFACNRLNFDRASYEHEVAQLKEWARKEKGRPLYLWLYYTFPVEIANGGKFHCFPGFFARAIGEQFRLFRESGVRGMFHCGYGQEVEAYLTYQLMDDPALDAEALLDDYFRSLYGPAAGPMKRLYTAIEQTYSNPANYPEAIASGRKEGHHHQTEEVAWGYLGTPARMARFEALLSQAKAAAQTAEQKHRVTLFETGVWEYMTAGRQMYLERVKARYGGMGAPLRVPVALDTPPAGDPTKVVRDECAVLSGWRTNQGERSRRDVEARLLNDGKCLYVQLEEKTDPKTLRSPADVLAGDRWEIIVAGQRARPFRVLAVGPTGKIACREFGAEAAAPPAPWESGAAVVSQTTAPGRWTVSLALPLDRLLPGGVPAGGRLYANLARRSPGSADEPVCVPTFGDFQDAARLRELTLETADAIPSSLPTDAEMQALQTKDLVGLWRLDEGAGVVAHDSSPNALHGAVVGSAAWAKEGGHGMLRLEDRRGQYVEMGSPEALNLAGALTLEAWVKYEPSDVWYRALLGKGYEQTGAYSLHLRPGLTVWFEIDSPDGTRNIYNPTDLTLTAGAWCHVAATYDGATMRVCINGRPAGPGKEVKTEIRKTSEPFRIGWLGSYGYLNACVRDVALYRRAMAPGEVFARYKAGKQ